MDPKEKVRVCIASAIIMQVLYLMIAVGSAWRADHLGEVAGIVFVYPWYPIAVQVIGWEHMNTLGFVLVFVFLFQWPAYGWVVGSGWAKGRFWQYVGMLAVVHVLAVILGLRYYGN